MDNSKKYRSLSRAVASAYNAASIARSVLAPGHASVDAADRAAFALLVELVDVPMSVAYAVADCIRAELEHGEITDASVRDLHAKVVAEHAEYSKAVR